MTQRDKTSGVLPSALLAAALVLVGAGQRIVVSGTAHTMALGGAVLGFIAACALRARSLRAARGDVRAVEVRLFAGHLGVAAALALYGASKDVCLDAVGLADTAREHVAFALSLAWPSVLLCSVAALFFMELVYARMPIAASVELRRVRTAAFAGLTLALSAIFVVAMSYVATVHDVRRDVSYFKTTQPSAGTAAMLDKLDAKVTAVLFWRKTDDVLAQVEPYFASLARRSKNLRYEVVDAALAPELTRKHKVSGNGSVVLLVGEGDKQKAEVLRVGKELIDARASLKKLDSLFQQHFAKLTRPARTVRITVGHGERNAKQDDVSKGEGAEIMRSILTRMHLKTDDLGLAQGLGGAVPEGSSAVVVLGPRDKFLPEESAALLSYVRNGGRLLLAVDPGSEDGLDALLAGLGVMRRPGTLASEEDFMKRTHSAADRTVVFSNAYSAHPSATTANRYRAEVATIFVNGAALDRMEVAAGEPKPSVSFPLRSGPKFFRDLDANFERGAGEPEETLNMIAAVTIPAHGNAAEGRALIVGDGDFIADKLAGNNGNMMVFVDALAWLVGSEDLSAEVSSEEDSPIAHTREQDKVWFYATTFAAPIPVAGFGLWIARRRRRRAEAGS